MAFECDGLIIGLKSKVLDRRLKEPNRATKNAPSDPFVAANIRKVEENPRSSKILQLNRKHRNNPGRLIQSIRKMKSTRSEEDQLFESAVERIRGYKVVDDERVVKGAVKRHKAKLKKRKRVRAERDTAQRKKREKEAKKALQPKRRSFGKKPKKEAPEEETKQKRKR